MRSATQTLETTIVRLRRGLITSWMYVVGENR